MDSHRITTPFGATSTAMEVVEGADLSGRRAIVTEFLAPTGRIKVISPTGDRTSLLVDIPIEHG